jgi:hypothetical protein
MAITLYLPKPSRGPVIAHACANSKPVRVEHDCIVSWVLFPLFHSAQWCDATCVTRYDLICIRIVALPLGHLTRLVLNARGLTAASINEAAPFPFGRWGPGGTGAGWLGFMALQVCSMGSSDRVEVTAHSNPGQAMLGTVVIYCVVNCHSVLVRICLG